MGWYLDAVDALGEVLSARIAAARHSKRKRTHSLAHSLARSHHGTRQPVLSCTHTLCWTHLPMIVISRE